MALVVPTAAEMMMLNYMTSKVGTENLHLRLYANDITPGESDTVATYTEVSGGGYAAVALTPASWVTTPGDPSQTAYPQTTFAFTGAVGNVYGYYLTRFTGGELMWVERFSNGPYNIQNNGDEIRVTPIITLE